METLRGVLLDIDGTLVDSNDAHARAWVAALAERDLHVGFAAVRPLIGMGGDKLLPAVSDLDPESPAGQAVAERRSEIFRERYLPSVTAFPESRALLQRMRADGLTLVAASSARADELKELLARAGAKGLLADSTSADDAARSKPDPDIVQEAVRRSGHQPGELVMLGDTPYDLEAATRAGVRLIAFRCGGWKDPDFRGAAAVYDGPADLLARYDDSLLARSTRR